MVNFIQILLQHESYICIRNARAVGIGARISGPLGSRGENLLINRNPENEPGFFFEELNASPEGRKKCRTLKSRGASSLWPDVAGTQLFAQP
jgi:hypothetical protein